MNIALVFPHQLFQDNPIFKKIDKKNDKIFLVEDYLFFQQYKFHKQKLVLHRASMKSYEKYLIENNFTVEYIESKCLKTADSLRSFIQGDIKKTPIEKIIYCEVVDNYLEKSISEIVKNNNFKVEVLETKMFLNTDVDNKSFFTKPDGSLKKPFMKTFYEWQRNRLNILMLAKNKPVGGKYNFDTENRKKLPKNFVEPENLKIEDNQFIQEAKKYVEKNFADNYGLIDNFNYAIDFHGAKKILKNFLEKKLENFGVYEDSISSQFKNINHSVLTPYLNTGLMTPEYVVKETLKYAKENSKKIPINSLEGFLRQIIGWREFMRAMYVLHGTKMRSSNFFNHEKKLEEFWWTGNVKVENTPIGPVNNSIKNLLETGYNHHIERLMILGNFMILSEYRPNDIYEWFMTIYIDSYDWVMVPNVYGMSQFSDGGIFATKPYISASNYILKMSDYKKEEWSKVWDELFWNFLKKHKTFFSKNIRFKMLLSRIK